MGRAAAALRPQRGSHDLHRGGVGADFVAIQPALDVAMPGDTVRVHEKPTPYVGKLVLPRSGAPGAYVTLETWPGEHPP
jgi:hypothetical protein